MSKNLSNVDLNLLVALDALLSEQNVTRAAERLLVGQSAMSSTLRRLRKLFNDPLLVREGRGLTPTPLALSLVEPVGEALEIIQSVLTHNDDFDPAVDHRTFTICTSDYATLVLIKPLLEKLDAIAPGVRINITPLGVEDYFEELRRQHADLLIIPQDFVSADLPYRSQLLFMDHYLVAAAHDHPEVQGEISLEQFSSLPYVTYMSGRNESLVDAQLNRLEIPRSMEVTAQSFVLAPLLLPRTRMIMLIHHQLGSIVAEQLKLQLLAPPVPLEPTSQTMLWNDSVTGDPGHRWLREQLAELAANLDTQQPEPSIPAMNSMWVPGSPRA